MPWQEETRMSLRADFVALSEQHSIPFSQLCARFGISRKTGYKWLKRAQSNTPDALRDQSRRPHHSPGRTPLHIEKEILAVRHKHPAWGGRKIARVLQNRGIEHAPAPSTITHILARHGLIEKPVSGAGARYQRFEHEEPNQLWQMDFKGYFQTASGRCDPLTVVDDHSRYNIVLDAMWGNSTAPVQKALTKAFQTYGLPYRMNMDNGQPWGSPRACDHGLSPLSAWLVRQGIRISFSRPAHPQTNGKDERFHRSFKAEVLRGRSIRDLKHAQQCFDEWRDIYNHERPHEGIGMAVPADRYQASPRAYTEDLPAITYEADDIVVVTSFKAIAKFKGHELKMPKCLKQVPIAFHPQPENDGVYDVYFCHHRFRTIDLRDFILNN